MLDQTRTAITTTEKREAVNAALTRIETELTGEGEEGAAFRVKLARLELICVSDAAARLFDAIQSHRKEN